MRASQAMGGDQSDPTPEITPDDLEWEHSYNRTPYENVRNAYYAMQRLDREVSDLVVKEFAARWIPAASMSMTARALQRIKEEQTEDSE